MSNSNRPRGRSGQVMVITVLALGGTILGATVVAGLLMLYQIRQATDLGNSARAIFAADAGVEWGLYVHTCGSDPVKAPCPTWNGSLTLGNGATVSVACTTSAGDPVDCDDTSVAYMRSVGKAATAARAFGVSF